MNKEFNPYEFNLPDKKHKERVEKEVVHVEQPDESDLPWLEDEEGEEGDDQGDDQGDEEESPSDAAARALADELRRKREKSFYWQFMSGSWMVHKSTTSLYRYLLVLAVMLLLSVVSIFYTFHLSAKLNRRTAHVQLLRERSLEFKRTRFNATSHTAILEELKRRNIPVYDIQQSKTIIE